MLQRQLIEQFRIAMKKLQIRLIAVSSLAWVLLLVPLAATAQIAAHGLYAHSFFRPENASEPHPQELQIAVAITEDMVDGESKPLPVYFGFQYAASGASKTKVIVQVKVYRGAKQLGQAKAKMRHEPSYGHAKVNCKPFNKGLLAGDLIEFKYTFKKAPKPGKVSLIRLLSVAGPAEMWENDPWQLWPLREQFFSCS